ncbi:MAG: cell division protein FtsZ [Chitinophagaceae bacterium]
MIQFDLPKEKSSILKVIGVGGGGSNAVNHMFNQNIDNVNFIICNTDAQAIAQSNVPNKIQLGPHLTQGLGAGANPEIGKQATEESLEEIKRILEVNTKMAFITAGMGGGTGTGGAPIIAKICKDLDVLTVGIVTTPFAYEGKKRQQQAEEGINQLKQYVDTLLVISNDKLRHQYGNLKMKDAFGKADNVLATAAKCITDVINSTGQINVDFADVCTVMRDGGVAILGNAMAEGDNRAHKAIEEALNSPLLNDNDIRGAKWILININSAEGDHEFTMDEVEIIQNYLLSHAGDDTDVILGLGYDNNLEKKIGITLIATGFEHKTPFYKKEEKLQEPKKEEKVFITLNMPMEDQGSFKQLVMPLEEKKEVAPERLRQHPVAKEEIKAPEHALMPKMVEVEPERPKPPVVIYAHEPRRNPPVEKDNKIEKFDLVYSQPADERNDSAIFLSQQLMMEPAHDAKQHLSRSEQPQPVPEKEKLIQQNSSPSSAVSGGYLAKPSNIYAASPTELPVPPPPAANKGITPHKPTLFQEEEEESVFEMKLVVREDVSVVEEPESQPEAESQIPAPEENTFTEETEEQRRRAMDRIQKLRNLSFNINGTDATNEFENVPAYIRRNLELYNTVNNVENFYSSYTVKPDDNNKSQISTINTFLDGKKPD